MAESKPKTKAQEAQENAQEEQNTTTQAPAPKSSIELGDGEKIKLQDFDEFFSFDEEGKSLTAVLMGNYNNVNIGEDGFTGYLFREWIPGVNEEDRPIYAVASSWQLDKVFGAGDAVAEPENVYKITLKGKKDIKGGRTVKQYNIVRYENPEFKA